MGLAKGNLQNAYRKAKSKVINLFTEEKDEDSVYLSIEVDPQLYMLIQEKAKSEQTTEQEVVLRAIRHRVEHNRSAAKLKIPDQRKESNPLFHLSGFVKTLE